MGPVFLALALLVSFGVSYAQARALVRIGSDHAVHLFLISVIRENRHRLFSRVPRLLNESYCSAYPIFLHWCLSFLPPRGIEAVARLLNPCVNAALVVVVYASVRAAPDPALAHLAGPISLLFALTPQFFHANSARNYGISSRPVGLFLLTVCLLLVYRSGAPGREPVLLGAVAAGYLIWGFNTFAQQALVLFGTLLGALFGWWTPLLVAALSLVLFAALHAAYAPSYLWHTALFIRAYATDLAAVFILPQRYSIWRDLVYDVWKRLGQSLQKGLGYAYNNAVLIVVLLNPLTIGAVLSWRAGAGPFETVCARLAAVGVAAFVLTSFRRTRFLGEPERYVELVSAFSSVAGSWWLYQRWGGAGLAVAGTYFALANLAQFVIVARVRRLSEPQVAGLGLVEERVRAAMQSEPVRFASNNEVLTKLLMTNPWSFARLWSAEQRLGGYPVRELFSEFPMVARAPFDAIVREHRVNICLLDKRNFADLFEHGGPAVRIERILDTDRYRLLRLGW